MTVQRPTIGPVAPSEITSGHADVHEAQQRSFFSTTRARVAGIALSVLAGAGACTTEACSGAAFDVAPAAEQDSDVTGQDAGTDADAMNDAVTMDVLQDVANDTGKDAPHDAPADVAADVAPDTAPDVVIPDSGSKDSAPEADAAPGNTAFTSIPCKTVTMDALKGYAIVLEKSSPNPTGHSCDTSPVSFNSAPGQVTVNYATNPPNHEVDFTSLGIPVSKVSYCPGFGSTIPNVYDLHDKFLTLPPSGKSWDDTMNSSVHPNYHMTRVPGTGTPALCPDGTLYGWQY